MTRLLAVYDRNNTLVMRFQYADGRMPVAMTKGGPTYYLSYDQVGTPKLIADVAGNVVKILDYDSFGNLVSDSAPSFTIPFGFAGGLNDPDTGLVRFGFRDYDPDVGRWTAKDPILFKGLDTNLYGYVQNDPVNLIDPSGDTPFIIGGVIGGFGSGFLGGAIVGAVGSWSNGDSAKCILKNTLYSGVIGGVVGSVAGGMIGAGLIGPGAGLISSQAIRSGDFWAGVGAGLGIGESAALGLSPPLPGVWGALAGGLAGIVGPCPDECN